MGSRTGGKVGGKFTAETLNVQLVRGQGKVHASSLWFRGSAQGSTVSSGFNRNFHFWMLKSRTNARWLANAKDQPAKRRAKFF
jgi:hypothetical protein